MMTVHEVSEITGVSIRALHHYDNIGFLPATKVTNAGYRMYDEAALERLHLPIRQFRRIVKMRRLMYYKRNDSAQTEALAAEVVRT